MVIYKYQLNQTSGSQSIMMPRDLALVHAGEDPSGHYCVWALVDKASTPVRKRLRIVGTGEDYDHDEWTHAFTWVTDKFVWHLLTEKDFYKGRQLPR